MMMCFSFVPGTTLFWNGHSAFIGSHLTKKKSVCVCFSTGIKRMLVGDSYAVICQFKAVKDSVDAQNLSTSSLLHFQPTILHYFFPLFGKVLGKAISIIHFYHAELLKQNIMRKKCFPQSGLKLIFLIKTITLTYHLWSKKQQHSLLVIFRGSLRVDGTFKQDDSCSYPFILRLLTNIQTIQAVAENSF